MTGTPAGMTIGEVGRILVEVRDAQREFRTEVNDKFSALDGTYVRSSVHVLVVKQQDERISKLEANQAWLVRIIVSGIVMAVLTGLFAAGSSFGGLQ